MTIEKVYDELISMITDLQKKGGGGGASIVFVDEYTAPEPGKIYVLTSGINVQAVYVKDEQIVYTLYGYVPNTIHVLDDDYTDVLQAPVIMSEDGFTHVDLTNKYLQLKSGSGTFTSFFKCSRLVDTGFYEEISVTYTFGGQTYTEQVALNQLTDASDRIYLGFYYNTSANGNGVGIAYFNELTPNYVNKYSLKTSTSSSGDVKITNFTIL